MIPTLDEYVKWNLQLFLDKWVRGCLPYGRSRPSAPAVCCGEPVTSQVSCVKRYPSHTLPAAQRLTCNDLLFINEYLANGRNGTDAYQKVHPKASYATARVEARRVLAKPAVSQEIAKRIKHEAGITRELVESDLMVAREIAHEQRDSAEIRAVAMDMAKLAQLYADQSDVNISNREYLNEIRRISAERHAIQN